MGLLGPSTPLDEDLDRAFIDGNASVRKLVARAQAEIRAVLRPGEQVRGLATDHYTASPTLVVTDRRMLVLSRNMRTVQRSVDAEEIHQAVGTVAGHVTVSYEGGTVSIRVGTNANAQTLVRVIEDALLTRRPRTIPTLYPDFFLSLLAAAGTSATPVNVSRFIERTFVMLTGQANTFFDQRGDTQARATFAERFADGGPQERILHSADDVIDWLWQWDRACHGALERVVEKWRDSMLMPHSFLHTGGGDIPPWSQWASK